MIPVDVPIGTPFGARSRLWSCDRNAAGEGIHTGVDFPAGVGTPVTAARDGVAVWCDHGADFGQHQLEVRRATTRDFYAHMSARTVADGAHVKAGQQVGKVGREGNVTGPHLHFERHAVPTGPWSCAIVRNPQPSLDWEPPDPKNQEFTMGYRDWSQKDKDALTSDVAKQVLDQPVNVLAGAKGEDMFEGVTVRDALKAVYRRIVGSK
jgi:murein DD-endopeptidase MepM/ murein hydrolase activator NlpD